MASNDPYDAAKASGETDSVEEVERKTSEQQQQQENNPTTMNTNQSQQHNAYYPFFFTSAIMPNQSIPTATPYQMSPYYPINCPPMSALLPEQMNHFFASFNTPMPAPLPNQNQQHSLPVSNTPSTSYPSSIPEKAPTSTSNSAPIHNSNQQTLQSHSATTSTINPSQTQLIPQHVTQTVTQLPPSFNQTQLPHYQSPYLNPSVNQEIVNYQPRPSQTPTTCTVTSSSQNPTNTNSPWSSQHQLSSYSHRLAPPVPSKPWLGSEFTDTDWENCAREISYRELYYQKEEKKEEAQKYRDKYFEENKKSRHLSGRVKTLEKQLSSKLLKGNKKE